MAFDLQARLRERHARQCYRQPILFDGPSGRICEMGERLRLNFCSNDYLGLANDPRVVAAFRDAAEKWGVGSGASHLVCGHQRPHHELEEALAEHTGRERALLFSTGYMANLGAITALVGRGDAVFQDRLNHASLLDAGLLSGARSRRFAHADAAELAARLARSDAQRKLVVTDGVFSMDGDQAPLAAYLDACDAHDAWLMVDDAHGLGVLGEQGRGVAHAQRVNERVPVYVGTLGKALGTAGAFVAGSAELIETLIQFARTYIYTTAMPAALAVATSKSLLLARNELWRHEQLAILIERFRRGAIERGYTLTASDTPIQPILVGDAGEALALSRHLEANGVLVTAIRPPTVPEGQARLRVTLSALHRQADVDRLLELLGNLPPSKG